MKLDKPGWNRKIIKIIEFNHELFSTLLVTFLILVLAEIIWDGSVSAHMEINYFLIIVAVSGVISALTYGNEKEDKMIISKNDYLYIGILGTAGALIVWYKIQGTGKLAYILSTITGIIIILLSLMIYDREDIND